MSQRATRPRMTGEIRFRVPLVVLPVLVLLGIALITFGFSRVLLALEAEVATVVALVSAANLLGACAFIALRPEAARRRWPELAAVVIYPVLIGIAVAQTGYGQAAEEPAEATEPSGGAAAGEGLVAQNTAFNTEELTADAGDAVSFTLQNEDQTAHNFALYETEEKTSSPDNAIYTSPTAEAGASAEVSFKAPEESGDYPFICDFHPTTMTGTLVVSASGDEGDGGGGGGGGSKGDSGNKNNAGPEKRSGDDG